jgi:hypothetical protein
MSFVHMGSDRDHAEAVESIKYNLGVSDDEADALLAYCAVGKLPRSTTTITEGLYASVQEQTPPKLRAWIEEMIDFGSQTTVVITRPEAK